MANYPDQIPTDGLTFYLRLNESSGTTAADSSINGEDGTINGSPTLGGAAFVTGGASMTFGFSTAQNVSLASDASRNWGDHTADFSVAVWFTVARHNTTDFPNLITLRGPTAAFKLFASNNTAYRDINLGWSSGGSKYSFDIPSFAINTDYFLVFCYDASPAGMLAYVNGQAIPVLSESDAFSAVTNENKIGASSGAGWDGRIAEVARWNRMLTTDEVYELWNYASIGGGGGGGGGGLVPGANTTLAFPLDA